MYFLVLKIVLANTAVSQGPMEYVEPFIPKEYKFAYGAGKKAYGLVKRYLSRSPSWRPKTRRKRGRSRTPRPSLWQRMYGVPKSKPVEYFGKRATGVRQRRRRKRYRLKAGESLGPVQISRVSTAAPITSSINQVAYHDYALGQKSTLQALVGEYYQIGERDDNTTEQIEQIGRQSYPGMSRILVKSMSLVVKFRNNSSFPADMILYDLKPKIRTDVLPSNSIAAGLDDWAGSTQNWETEPMFFPSNSKTFHKRYRTLKSMRVRLNPGEEYSYVLRRKGAFIYDDDWEDNTSDKDHTQYRSRFLMVRMCGVISHDSTDPNLVGIAQTAVDVVTERRITWQHLTGNVIARHNYTDGYDTVAAENIAQADVTTDEIFDT